MPNDDVYVPKVKAPPKTPFGGVKGSASVTKPKATIGAPPRQGLGAKGAPPPTRPTPVAMPQRPPQLTWSPLFGLRYGGNQARIGTYGPEINQGDAWLSASDYLNKISSASASGSEPKNTGTYEPPEDNSWREYLADPSKPEEAAPSLVEQSRIMGAIARAIANLDAGGMDVDDGDYMFDSGGYGWGDGGGWGGGGGYSPYGPDSMLYMWRIGL